MEYRSVQKGHIRYVRNTYIRHIQMLSSRLLNDNITFVIEPWPKVRRRRYRRWTVPAQCSGIRSRPISNKELTSRPDQPQTGPPDQENTDLRVFFYVIITWIMRVVKSSPFVFPYLSPLPLFLFFPIPSFLCRYTGYNFVPVLKFQTIFMLYLSKITWKNRVPPTLKILQE